MDRTHEGFICCEFSNKHLENTCSKGMWNEKFAEGNCSNSFRRDFDLETSSAFSFWCLSNTLSSVANKNTICWKYVLYSYSLTKECSDGLGVLDTLSSNWCWGKETRQFLFLSYLHPFKKELNWIEGGYCFQDKLHFVLGQPKIKLLFYL